MMAAPAADARFLQDRERFYSPSAVAPEPPGRYICSFEIILTAAPGVWDYPLIGPAGIASVACWRQTSHFRVQDDGRS